MRVVQFGLGFSENVGDGIIAECLAHGLRDRRPGTEVTLVDLSGRDGFGHAVVPRRALLLRILRTLPGPLRRAVVRRALGRQMDRVAGAWRRAAAGADLAVIGGGQLFSDADLNFCVKVSRASRLLADLRVPVAVFAVGASRNWSRAGARLFMDVGLTDLRLVGLRDAPSAAAWRDQMTAGTLPEPVLTRDPGLLAAACYGRFEADQTSGRRADEARVALCVTSPDILAYHADMPVAGSGRDPLAFLRGVTLGLVERGVGVELFCNGAAEDRAALGRLAADPGLAPALASGQVVVAPPPERPVDLARIIARSRAVAAHRLHACIVAYAYGLPVVGFGWDRKVESFFESVGALDRFVGQATADPAQVAALVAEGAGRPLEPERHAAVLAEAWAAIDRLIEAADGGGRAPNSAAG